MAQKDRGAARQWTGLAAVATLLGMCLILFGGHMTAAHGLPEEEVTPDRAEPAALDALAVETAIGWSAGPQQVDEGFTVDLTYDAVWGLVDAGDMVTVSRTVDGAYGASMADGAGFFWTPLWQSNGQPADITDGDTIDIYVNGGLDASIPVVAVNGGIDVLADQVVGTIAGDTGDTLVTLTLGVDGQPPGDIAPQQTVTTNGTGSFVAAFASVDLGPSILVAVEYPQGGHSVRTYLYPDPRVFLVHNLLFVRGYAEPGQQVDITCYEGSGPTVRWSTEGTAGAPHGRYNIRAAGSIQAGDVVEVDLGVGQDLATTVAAMSVSGVDPALEQVLGTAPPGAAVTLRMWRQGAYAQTTATANGNGDFTTVFLDDLRPRDEFQVAVADADGDESLLFSGAPFIYTLLDPFEGGVDAVYWRVDGPGLPVTLTIQTATDLYTRTGLVSSAGNRSGPNGHVIRDAYGVLVDFSPGDTVTVRSPTWEGSMVIPEVTWSVDTAADRVSGEAPPGEVEVYAYQWYNGQYPIHGSAVQTSTAVSPYSVVFPGFDVRGGGSIQVRHFDPTSGYGTNSNWLGNLATQYFQAHIGDVLEGNPPHAGEVVTATLSAPDGTELASTSEDEDDDPWRFRFHFGDEHRIEPGRWVTVTSESGWTAGLQVPDLTAKADEEADLIWGEAPKGWVVVGHGWDHGAGWQWADYLIPVDGYLLDVASFGVGIQKGDGVRVTYPAPNGNRVRTHVLWPRMGANHGEDRVSGNYPVGHTFWITVTDGGGLLKATAVATTTFNGAGHAGGFYDGFETQWGDWFPRQPDLLPYDRVDYRADDGYTNSVRLGAIDGGLDVGADTVSGTITAPWLAGETLEGAAVRMGYPGLHAPFTVTLDAMGVGDFLGSFSPTDLLPGMDVDVVYQEPDLDYVANVFPEPEPEGHILIRAFYGRDTAEGNTTPQAQVQVRLYNSQGTWKDEQFTTAGLDGEYEIPELTADMVPGDWLAATSSDGTATSLQIIQIEGALDLGGDTVAGTMYGPGAEFPAKGMVRVHTPADGRYEWPLEIDSEGGYFLDMTAQHDLADGDEVQVFYGPWGRNQTGRDFYAEAVYIYLPLVVRNQ